MNPDAIADLVAWISETGLGATDEAAFLADLCTRARAAGLPLSRALVFVDTLHPIYEGQALRWYDGKGVIPAVDYEPMVGERLERWQQSPFFHMLETGETCLRVPINAGTAARYPIAYDLAGGSATEYVSCITRFGADDVIGGLDCVYSSWITETSGGFTDAQVVAIRKLLPPFALALKSRALTRIARTLVETYLGRDAGRRVLDGSIVRGAVERISTALWMSDLREFTRLAEAARPDELIPFLDDYADAVIAAIHDAGGDVLKLIGDGTLAIFPAADQALLAAERAISEIAALSLRRAEAGLPHTSLYLGLHVGDVFFGNIGSRDRLDFTVIGPAVNEVSRIAAMCHSLDQRMLISSAFADQLGAGAERLVSVGRYALRGVGGAQHLYTLDPVARVL
jgi:adenylate cyclase